MAVLSVLGHFVTFCYLYVCFGATTENEMQSNMFLVDSEMFNLLHDRIGNRQRHCELRFVHDEDVLFHIIHPIALR